MIHKTKSEFNTINLSTFYTKILLQTFFLVIDQNVFEMTEENQLFRPECLKI